MPRCLTAREWSAVSSDHNAALVDVFDDATGEASDMFVALADKLEVRARYGTTAQVRFGSLMKASLARGALQAMVDALRRAS
ncbi:MAG: hypothetical protein JO243_09800 [Solirubrobacterales bacterium]|nr:hypothetical protein [Solirubrobacterales bacterium]